MTTTTNENKTNFSVNVTIYSNQYYLQYLNCWGGPWESTPTDIPANESKNFVLNSNDRGGIWFRAINPNTQDEAGFVTMSFICPMLSDNSAEGSPGNGPFISAGLQQYDGAGHPLNTTYKVGTLNEACWGSGKIDDGKQKCSQTTFADKRLIIEICNPNNLQLDLGDYWNGDIFSDTDWYWQPTDSDAPPPNCMRTVILKVNGIAGLYLKVLSADRNKDVGFTNISFQSGIDGTNYAEGSPGLPDDTLFFSPGLQTYQKTYDGPIVLRYNIGSKNLACWNSGNSDDGKIHCSQTNFGDRRALIKVKNTIPEELTFAGYWNDNKVGKTNWYIEPSAKDSMRAEGERLFVLKDNDRAGLYFKQAWMEFHLSFTCPKLSNNSAEGSPHAGLQKYSDSGTPVNFTYDVGTPNLACWESGSTNNGSVICKQTLVLPFHLRRWMGKLNEEYPNKFKSITLRNLYIPGTHDAACYEIIQTPWGQTQELDYYNQLIKGVRYMDLRPNYVPETSPNPPAPGHPAYNNFHHGPLTTINQLGNLISDIVRFYTEDWVKRSFEVIILDFTHFNYYSIQADWECFFNTILNSALNQYLIPQGNFGPTTTLNTLWSASTTQRVIASVSSDAYTAYQAMTGNKPNIWKGENLFAPGWDGSTFWPNKDNEQDLVNFINKNIDTFSANTNLWMLQTILTATGARTTVRSLVGQARDALYGPTGLPWRSKTNVVITDYYDERSTIETIMENIKRMS